MTAMEEEGGRETLLELVNEHVMAEAAEQRHWQRHKGINSEIALIHEVHHAIPVWT